MSFWGKKEEKNITTKQPETAPAAAAASASASSTPAPALPVMKSASHEPQPSAEPYGKVRSALGPGTVIQGRLSFDTVVSIDGKLGGEIFSSKALLVGPSGVVDAKIEAQILIVKGQVRGTINATERVEIRGSGQIIGDVNTPILVMDPGCILHGSCTMPQVKNETASKQPEHRKESKDAAEISPAQISSDVEQIAIV